MLCPHRVRFKTSDGQYRMRDCRKCRACQLSRQYDWANRLAWEITRAGAQNCYYFTGTYNRENLPWSPGTRPGQILPAQEKLFDAFLRHPPRTEEARRFQKSCIAEMNSGTTPRPEVRRKHLQDWKKRVEKAIGFTPRILSVGEYGTRHGRPHVHAAICGINPHQAQLCLDAWHFSDPGRSECVPVQSNKIGSYIAKDLVKGSWSKQAYIAAGREPHFMLWPVRPQLAAGQEAEIYKALSTWQKAMGTVEFEQALQCEHLARSYKMPISRRNAKPDAKPKRVDIMYGRTAYAKAVEALERDEKAATLVAGLVAQNAHLECTHIDPTHDHFQPEHLVYHEEKMVLAQRALDRAQDKHRLLLERRGLGSSGAEA